MPLTHQLILWNLITDVESAKSPGLHYSRPVRTVAPCSCDYPSSTSTVTGLDSGLRTLEPAIEGILLDLTSLLDQLYPLGSFSILMYPHPSDSLFLYQVVVCLF